MCSSIQRDLRRVLSLILLKFTSSRLSQVFAPPTMGKMAGLTDVASYFAQQIPRRVGLAITSRGARLAFE